jgi:hypothetical protein
VLHREDKEIMDLCPSERLWVLRNRDEHQLVPVEQERTKKQMKQSLYFYVSPKYTSKWAPDQPELLYNGQGVAILRNKDAEGKIDVDEKDFKVVSADGKQVFYGLHVNFTVFQWIERPNTRERYILSAGLKREDDIVWREFGITNPDAYAAIMLANTDIPMHLMLNFWRKSSLERPANDPAQINRKAGTENIRGYYDFIIDHVEPDYLRYFRQHGMRVSEEFVRTEFEEWASTSKKNNALRLILAPFDHTKANPLHKLQGIGSAVISLGNGQPAPGELKMPEGCGFNHGYSGDVSSVFTGNHDFYVLTSRLPPAGAIAAGGVADDWLQNTIAEAEASNSPFYYWIFAVAKNAKLARTPVPKIPVSAAVPPPAETKPEINENGKRLGPTTDWNDEYEEGEEVE